MKHQPLGRLRFSPQAPARPSKVRLFPAVLPCAHASIDTAPHRPVRSNRGIGGQRAQLERAADIVGEGLLNKVMGQKRDRNNVAIPEDISENDLAPPMPTKRARKAVITFLCLRNEITNYSYNQNIYRPLSRPLELPTEQNNSKLHRSLS